MNIIMGKILHRLLRRLGLKPIKREYRLDLDTAEILEDIALEQARDPAEIAADLLSEGIARQQQTELNSEIWTQLTPREQEVVALICLGYMNKEIADKLDIGVETVKTHVINVLRKFGANRRGQVQRLLMDWDFTAWDR
jgi:DNA-binding NarL/FixJ family response regulator